jgi:hypothetical protein
MNPTLKVKPEPFVTAARPAAPFGDSHGNGTSAATLMLVWFASTALVVGAALVS